MVQASPQERLGLTEPDCQKPRFYGVMLRQIHSDEVRFAVSTPIYDGVVRRVLMQDLAVPRFVGDATLPAR
jgi:hypothetical protein